MKHYLMILDDATDQVVLMRAVFNIVDPLLEIISAGDGDEGLRMLRCTPKRLPKAILLDWRLPKKTGLEILTELKADPLFKSIPVSIFSSSDCPSDIRAAYEHGASAYFKKPIGLDNLLKFAEHFKGIWFDFAR